MAKTAQRQNTPQIVLNIEFLRNTGYCRDLGERAMLRSVRRQLAPLVAVNGSAESISKVPECDSPAMALPIHTAKRRQIRRFGLKKMLSNVLSLADYVQAAALWT